VEGGVYEVWPALEWLDPEAFFFKRRHDTNGYSGLARAALRACDEKRLHEVLASLIISFKNKNPESNSLNSQAFGFGIALFYPLKSLNYVSHPSFAPKR
jgi:hypothetical protein